MPLPYRNRAEAGPQLAEALKHCANRPDVFVQALPRGGVPMAYAIAKVLEAPLDLLLVRKLGVPGQEELAMGAVAMEGTCVSHDEIIRELAVSDAELDRVVTQERRALQHRAQAYRGERPAPEIQGRCVMLVDDGLATGATMRAAIVAVRPQAPAEIVVAVPIAPKTPSHRSAKKSIMWSAWRRRSRSSALAIGTRTSRRSPIRKSVTCCSAPGGIGWSARVTTPHSVHMPPGLVPVPRTGHPAVVRQWRVMLALVKPSRDDAWPLLSVRVMEL